MRWKTLSLAAALVPLLALGRGAAAEEPRISGPFVHENLAVYMIHGRSAPGPVPLTLAEAMAGGQAIVHETGSVNRLMVENTGDREVFIQAGDIVKGGRQDRVLTVSLLLPPKSGRLDINAYCVEQGRWSQRGKEDVRRFASADSALPSREAKLALLKPRAPAPAATSTANVAPSEATLRQAPEPQRVMGRTAGSTTGAAASDTGNRQGEVWTSVAAAQRKLSKNLGAQVAAPASMSSLQLTLENARLAEARTAYTQALEGHAKGADVVGYVFAVGGRLNSGDAYASNGLFQKMWPKQLAAAITEAIAEKGEGAAGAAPTLENVRAFLARAEGGKPSAPITLAGAAIERMSREAESSVMTETRRAAGEVLHRSYLAY